MADPFSAAKAGAKIPGTGTGPIPFDQDRLHLAMDNAHLDAVLVTSKVNVRYLTGGYNCLFFATMNDPAFLAEAKKRKARVEPIDGATIEKMANEAFATPAPVLAELRRLLGFKK